MMKYLLPALLALSACAPAVPYAPIIDRPGPHYETDLAECRAINDKAQAAAMTQKQNEMVGQMLVGALIGAAVGSAYGNQYVGSTAAYGAAAGAASADLSGPKYIIDRCMAGRGYRVLSDVN